MTVPHVEKEPLAAEVFLADGSVFLGSIYLTAAPTTGHPMRQLLEGDSRLIPCRGESGELVLLGRRSVVAVRVDAEALVVPADLDVGLPMKVTTVGGHRFAGVLHMPSVVGSRISDLLNYADAWLVQVDDHRQVWLSSDQLLRVEAP